MSISILSYGLHKFKEGDIHTFIDIGAEKGSVSSFVRDEFSPSRIIALEPCKENFEALFKTNEEMGNFMECYNIAYGCGDDLWCVHSKSSYGRRFVTDYEWKLWDFGDADTYSVESKELWQIFRDYDIDVSKPCAIKMDCEGGERFLLDSMDDATIRKVAYFTAELHFFRHDFDGTPKEESIKHREFAYWLWANFSRTHDICIGKRRDYTLQHNVSELEDYLGRQKRTRHIRLIRKDWVKRFKS